MSCSQDSITPEEWDLLPSEASCASNRFCGQATVPVCALASSHMMATLEVTIATIRPQTEDGSTAEMLELCMSPGNRYVPERRKN